MNQIALTMGTENSLRMAKISSFLLKNGTLRIICVSDLLPLDRSRNQLSIAFFARCVTSHMLSFVFTIGFFFELSWKVFSSCFLAITAEKKAPNLFAGMFAFRELPYSF